MDKNARVKDLYQNPIGHDIVGKLLMQMGMSEKLITNPIVGNIKIKTLDRILKSKVGEGFFDALLVLLNSETDVPRTDHGEIKKAWWKEAVFYQIYPRSFMDTNGDGIGDLRGIIDKLDYIKDLGVDAIWLSPIYDSPNDDNGYDIRDYCKIMTEFGTMEDFDELLTKMHEKGLKLLMDLVVNHTSDEHEWFVEALKDENSKYRDYYFFRNNGKTNNWTSFFEGSAWNYYEEENTNALHLFSKKQMDLNWDNENVREDVIKMIKWWLNKGVDGFRMDVINYISKAEGLPEGNPFIGKLMGYTGVENYFYGPNLHKYLNEIKTKAFEPYNAFSVGETPGLGMEMCKLVTGEERHELDMVFSFDHLETPGHTRYDDYRYDLNYYKKFQIDWARNYGTNHRMSLFYNNHDNPRMVSKVNPDKEYKSVLAKLLVTMQLTLLGTPFIFQGDEMGLTNYEFKGMEDFTDVEALGIYEKLIKERSKDEAFKYIMAGTREHARVLLPWNENAPYKQEIDEEVYKYYKDLLKFRREHQSIPYGEFRVLRDTKDLFTYERKLENESIIVDCNLNIKPKKAYKIKGEYREVFTSNATGNELNAYGIKIFENV